MPVRVQAPNNEMLRDVLVHYLINDERPLQNNGEVVVVVQASNLYKSSLRSRAESSVR
jgi:hypothetical protein